MPFPDVVINGSLVGPRGPAGADGLPGVNAVPAKDAVDVYNDELLGDPDSATTAAVKQVIRDQLPTLPETYGAVGDGVTDDSAAFQDAIDELSSLGGGVLLCTAEHYRASFQMKEGVLLTSLADPVKWAGGPYSTLISPPAGWAGGWVIDSPATNIRACGIVGIVVSGGMTSTASPDTGGIRLQDATWATVEGCSTTATSLGGIRIHGTANKVRFNGVQNFWQWRDTPASAYEGALWCSGTDFHIEGNQANGGMALTDTLPSTDPTLLYQAANFFDLLTSVLIGGNGEFAQVGTRLRLHESVAFGIRADTNPGVGIHMLPSSFGGGVGGNRLVGTKLLANCLSPTADDVMDALYVQEINTDFDGILLGPDWTGGNKSPRYGVNDAYGVGGWTGRTYQDSPNRYRNVRTVYNASCPPFSWDLATRTYSFSFGDGGGGTAPTRQAARFCTGKTFADTGSTKLTYSDGVNWRDSATHAIVGNLLRPRTANLTDGVLKWSANNSVGSATCILERAYRAKFARPRVIKMKTTAAGVTAGFAAMRMQTSEWAAVTAGQNYQVGAYMTGPAGKSPQAAFTVTWYDAALAVISTTAAIAATAIGAGDVTPTSLMSGSLTAPALAVWASITEVKGTATGLAADDAFYLDSATIALAGGYAAPIEP